mgnify:CR=1 FL=1
MKYIIAAIAFAQAARADDCDWFQDLGCSSGDATTNPPEWADRAFQTYLPGSDLYQEQFAGLGRVMCYNHIQYTEDRQSATVTARCRQHDSVSSLEYNWNDEGFQGENTRTVDSSFSDALSLSVKASDGSTDFTIDLEPLNFVW